MMTEDHKSVDKPETYRRHDEHIHRGNRPGVIAQKGLPALRRPPWPVDHVLRNGRLSDLDPQLQQLAMDAWRTP